MTAPPWEGLAFPGNADGILQKIPTRKSEREDRHLERKINKRLVGGYYEDLTARYLENQGLLILERNYRCAMGEIDLIAREGSYVVFVEVKYRSSEYSGNPLYAVDRRKQRVIGRVALHYLKTHRMGMNQPCRFDVVGFEGNTPIWVPNAFEVRV